MKMKWWHWALIAGGGFFAYKMWKGTKGLLTTPGTEAAQVATTAEVQALIKNYEARLAQAGAPMTLGYAYYNGAHEIKDTASGAVLATGKSLVDLQTQLSKLG